MTGGCIAPLASYSKRVKVTWLARTRQTLIVQIHATRKQKFLSLHRWHRGADSSPCPAAALRLRLRAPRAAPHNAGCWVVVGRTLLECRLPRTISLSHLRRQMESHFRSRPRSHLLQSGWRYNARATLKHRSLCAAARGSKLKHQRWHQGGLRSVTMFSVLMCHSSPWHTNLSAWIR